MQSLLYMIWRPHLIKDTRTTPVSGYEIHLNDYTSDYKTRLTHLRLLPLVCFFEISDILFFINHLKNPTNNFNISTYFHSLLVIPDLVVILCW